MQLSDHASGGDTPQQEAERHIIAVQEPREAAPSFTQAAPSDDMDLCRLLAREAFLRGLPVAGPFPLTEWQARRSVNRLPEIQRRKRF